MDEIPAASAMQWNVDLDRGLRSQKTGKPFLLYINTYVYMSADVCICVCICICLVFLKKEE